MHGKVGRIIWNQSRYSSEKPPMPARLSNENLQVEGTFSDTSGPLKAQDIYGGRSCTRKVLKAGGEETVRLQTRS